MRFHVPVPERTYFENLATESENEDAGGSLPKGIDSRVLVIPGKQL